MNQKQLLDRIKKIRDDRDWAQFHDPKNIALSLSLEAAEVLELFQWTQDNDIDPEKKDQLPDELADVYYCLLYLADLYRVDLNSALESKLKKNDVKYPVEKFKGSSKKYNEL